MPSPEQTPPIVVGHRGALALAPENTVRGVEAAIAAGVGAVEVDVRRGRAGSLVLGHGRREARRPGAEPFADVLALLVAHPEVGLVVDVKQLGTEAELARAVVAAGLADRSVACARPARSLYRLGASAPGLRRAWTLGRRWHASAYGRGRRRTDVSAASAAAIAGNRCELVTVHRLLVTPRLIAKVEETGGEVWAWGVDEAGGAQALAEGRRLASLGVRAITVDDPRPFVPFPQ